jgi:hypothetical protein
MSELLEDFKQYLPKYLSPAATKKLFAELEQFPRNMDERLYTTRLRGEATVFQGDGLDALPVTNLPDETVGRAKVMVLSNTCDMDAANPRWMPARIIYCPVISLHAYERLLARTGSGISSSHFDDIRAQRVSNMFYLPKTRGTGEEAIALLDRVNNCDLKILTPAEVPDRRLFTLSDYGFYLFLYKLSIHFTRIREGVPRTS